MKFEKYTPERESTLASTRQHNLNKKFYKDKEGAIAKYVKDADTKEPRLEFTAEQVEEARKEMDAEKALTPGEKEKLEADKEALMSEREALKKKESDLYKEIEKMHPAFMEVRTKIGKLINKLPEGLKHDMDATFEQDNRENAGFIDDNESSGIVKRREILKDIPHSSPEINSLRELMNYPILDQERDITVELRKTQNRIKEITEKI